MTPSHDDIDEVIRQALGEADAETRGRLEGQSMAELLSATFRARIHNEDGDHELVLNAGHVNLPAFIHWEPLELEAPSEPTTTA